MASGESDTKVHTKFIKQPMNRKSVEAVPGIGPSGAGKLAPKITTAKQLYSLYLKNPEKFKDKLEKKYGLRPSDAQKAYDGMREWDEQNN